MKKVSIPVLGLLFALSFVSCKKDSTQTTAVLEVSKTATLQKGEPVLFTLPQASAGSIVNWSVNPSANSLISASGNTASIKFFQRGNYTVTAASGSITASSVVTVNDSTFTGGGSASSTLPFSAGEVIRITVSRIDSGANSGLLLSALTTNNYSCLSNSLIAASTFGANSYGINYTGVSVPGGCTTGSAKAGNFQYLFPVSAGSNSLTVNFNGNVYTGTIVKTGNSYTINWAYTTGVIISPTSL